MSADQLIQLSEHIDEFEAAIPRLAVEGRFWWYLSSDNTFHATAEKIEPSAGAMYLLDASPRWLEQFPDYAAIADALLETLIAAMDRPVENEEG